ncbi:MAG: CDP-glucose 4,6-dehydratase [Solirubrobacteraceae bacterium]
MGDSAARPIDDGAVARPAAVSPAFWQGRRVLLTGHTGFKGAWLSLWLQRLGAELTGVAGGVPTDPSLFTAAAVGEGMQTVAADVRDPDALARALAAARPEVVIHMAAQPLVRRSFAEPRLTFETNVMGTVNLLDAVRGQPGVRVVVNVTTDKCYENREWEWGYREDEPLGGHDPYAASKACSELVTSAYRRSFFAGRDAPRVGTARAGNVIGGGDWGEDRLVPDLARAAVAGDELRVRNPHSIRPWQHVLNPLGGYLLLAQSLWETADHAGAWNFGPPEEDAWPVSRVVERLADGWPGGLRWASDPGPHPHEARYLKLDSSRARARLGWRPGVGLEQALASVVDWYRAHAGGADMRGVTLAQIEALGRMA